MPDYIDRKKVKDEILSWAVCINNPNMLSRDDTLYCIDTISAADVAPVRHGRWWDKGALSCRCSECGCKSNRESKYCPNCGAKMDGDGNG